MASLLYDDIRCAIDDGIELKEEFQFDAEIMHELSRVTYDTWHYYIFGNTTVLKASVTELYRDMVRLISNVVSDDNHKKPKEQTLNYALYVTDSSTMLPFLNTIYFKPESIVDFASNIII